MGLFDAFRQYLRDAAPGGALNPEVTPQGILDATAMATMPVPVLGDITGAAADAYMFATDPSSRTPGNYALAGAGLLPFVPSMGMLGNIKQIDLPEGYKRLFNASTIEHDPQGWLEPHVSGWVEEVASGAGDFEDLSEITRPLIYMSESPDDWIKMIVGRKIGKSAKDVTIDDIKKHGRLNIADFDLEYDSAYKVGDYAETGKVTDLKGNRLKFYESDLYNEGDVYTREGRMVEMPIGPEPNDWITNQAIELKQSLTGDDLIKFLEQFKKK